MKRTLTAILNLAVILAALPAVSGELSLRYQPTGSTQLLYRVHFHSKDETTVTTSSVRFDSNALDEKTERIVSWRKLAINKGVRRQESAERPGELSNQIVSTIQSQDSSKGIPPLPSQRIANFFEPVTGPTDEPFAVEAIPYFGVPLSWGSGGAALTEWNHAWHLRLEDGTTIPLSNRYRLEKTGILAGRECALIAYQFDFHLTEGSRDLWTGRGSLAFDIVNGIVVSHQAKIIRKQETEEFRQTSRMRRRSETTFEVAEVLIP